MTARSKAATGRKRSRTSGSKAPAIGTETEAAKTPGKRKPAQRARGKKAGKARSAAAALEGRIDYTFRDGTLLEVALTHVSALTGSRALDRTGSYQRLEFLGDHVLGLVVSDMLFKAFPKATEGELSRRLASLVRKETCVDVARDIELGAAVRVGAPEASAGAQLRPAILADACEALIGAVYLDGGYAAAAAVVERLWGGRMRAQGGPARDSKTLLQEWAQGRGLPTPSYREISRSGPHHDPEFRIAVALPGLAPTEGLGRSKRSAEQAAAAAMLVREGVASAEADA